MVDATDIAFAITLPSNSNGTNSYRTETGYALDATDWIPAQAAIWSFSSNVKIPAYSQIVVAAFGAIDHTQTVTASVDLSNSEYYWLSNTDISTVYKAAKYKVSENIPATHYLKCTPFGQGTAWLISNSSPAFFIGKMSKTDATALSTNTAAFDHTCGAGAVFNGAKFPKAKVVDCVDVWNASAMDKNTHRYPSDVSTGYVALTNNLGHSVYRNVDKEATEALPENKGKLVYNYEGGVTDSEGNVISTDPSGIDAEASIKNGAHIVYSDLKDSGYDFHQRGTASLKK